MATDIEFEANALFIVKAVNNHQKLVEALKRYIEANRTARDDNDFRSKIMLAQQYAESLLTEVEQEK